MPPPAVSLGPRDPTDDDDDDPGMHSDESMPSLQTVSDSSDGENSDYSDEEVYEDFASDLEGDGNEGGDEVGDDMPPLVPSNENAQSRAQPAAPQRPRRGDDTDELYTYRISEDENEGVNENVHPSLSHFGRTLLSHWAATDRHPPVTGGNPFDGADPVLRSILGAMQLPAGIHATSILGAFRAAANPVRPDKDPQRAETILAALERVPEDLIHRYEKLRAGSGADDCDGCPICRESLLEEAPTMAEEDLPGLAFFAELPFNSLQDHAILAFPCPGKHVFHDSCLSPWLARKTTCPSCRFDVDPNSLTLRMDPPPRRPSAQPSSRTRQKERAKWEPPKVQPFKEWLEVEEYKAANPTPSPPRETSPPTSSHAPTAGPSSPSRLPALRRMEEVSEEDDDAWTTDDEEAEDDEEDDYDMNPPLGQNSLTAQLLAHMTPESVSVEGSVSNALFRSMTSGVPLSPRSDEDGGVGDMDDPGTRAARLRFLRSLMHPSNPLQLFLDDAEGDQDPPTLIPVRERGRAADAPSPQTNDMGIDGDDDEARRPPMLHVFPMPRPAYRPSPFSSQYEDDVDDMPPLAPYIDSSEEEELPGLAPLSDSEFSDEDDMPPLVGESARRSLPPWLNGDPSFDPARSFVMLNELARMMSSTNNPIEDVD